MAHQCNVPSPPAGRPIPNDVSAHGTSRRAPAAGSRWLGRSLGAALAVWMSLGGAQAGNISTTIDLVAPDQSFWSAGGPAASINTSGNLGGAAVGVTYSVIGSTGTVKADMKGNLQVGWSDWLLPGQNFSSVFRFDGASNGGSLSSLIGASIDVTGHALGGSTCILCTGASIAINKTYTPDLGTQQTGTGSATLASPSVGFNAVVGSVTAGVDLNIGQTLKFTPTAIDATVLATRASDGATMSENVVIPVDKTWVYDGGLALGLGRWDINLVNLTLDSLFSTQFVLGLDPYVAYTVGVGCGNPGTNSDNGWFCIADDKSSFHLANINLYQTPTFALAFNDLSIALGSVYVPEPASLAVFTVGIAGLWARRRRGAL